ncbi:hypothetical protein CR513_44021, partial [Mucuna pruriens]
MTMRNIFSMLLEIPMMKQEETGTWTAVAVITWQKIGACSRILITLTQSQSSIEKQHHGGVKRKRHRHGGWRQKNILLTLNLKENLLSIDQMMDKGYALHFEGDIYIVLFISKEIYIQFMTTTTKGRRLPKLKWRKEIKKLMIHGYGIEDLAISTLKPVKDVFLGSNTSYRFQLMESQRLVGAGPY